jgi:hypothetical protein
LKKFLPYVIAIVIVFLFVWLVYSTKKNSRVFDDRISFNKRDKIPYGMYVAYNSLPHIFPEASVSVNRKEPAQWDSLNSFSDKQTLIIIAPVFRADEFEMKRIVNFVRNGNSAFISTAMVSNDVQNILHSEIPDVFDVNDNLALNDNEDSFSVSLTEPPFSKKDEYGCPGKRFESYFSKYDSNISTVFGNGIYILPDFIQLKAGKGSLYFHLTPLAFSNYFLLYGKNINYYNKVLSLLPRDTKKVVWDEYFLYKRYSGSNNNNGSKSILSALMSQRSFRAALWLLIILLLVFIFQEMRRKQRIIPIVSRPENDSIEFVKTIGRLYHEKRDNKNLGHKMAAFFLEHIRGRYKLSTIILDEEFIVSLQRKTAQPENNIRKIISFINNIDGAETIDDEKLAEFHKELEEFYKVA